jgi:MoaA/NifB/PqqE/SkfB family radical SAM enzyme
MYACSPNWKADWISMKDADKILNQLVDKIQGSPFGPDKIDINRGLHFTGGEPFLNFDLLLKITDLASKLKIPSIFVETNCFWCKDDETTRNKLIQLKNAGLNGILISVNPFILEQVPFEKTERAFRISSEIFGENAIIYQDLFYNIFKLLKLKDTLTFEEFLQKSPDSLQYVELIPMGRAVYKIGHLFRKQKAKHFFNLSCKGELSRDWHFHIDNYGNYMTGYCGGISLGDAKDLNQILDGINLDEFPILEALITDLKQLYIIGVEQFDYKELNEGYISKCHLCVDIRKHIVRQTDKFKELKPKEFYSNLD